VVLDPALNGMGPVYPAGLGRPIPCGLARGNSFFKISGCLIQTKTGID